MGFIQSVWLLLLRTQDGVGKRVLERPMRKTLSVKEAEVRFPNNDMQCQDGLTTWGEPVVIDSIEERYCFEHNDGKTCLCKLLVFFRWKLKLFVTQLNLFFQKFSLYILKLFFK